MAYGQVMKNLETNLVLCQAGCGLHTCQVCDNVAADYNVSVHLGVTILPNTCDKVCEGRELGLSYR